MATHFIFLLDITDFVIIAVQQLYLQGEKMNLNLVRIVFTPVDLKSIFGLKEDKWNMKGVAPQWFDHCPI